MSNLVYGVKDKPGLWKTIVLALQQVLAILAATIVVPVIINTNEGLNAMGIYANMSQSAALFGAGVGTIVFLLFTKFKSPVFLGSSFAFIGSMCAAFAGGASVSVGYIGLIIGTVIFSSAQPATKSDLIFSRSSASYFICLYAQPPQRVLTSQSLTMRFFDGFITLLILPIA